MLLHRRSLVGSLIALIVLGGLVWLTYGSWRAPTAEPGSREARGPAPVEVAAVTHGPIEYRRTFSGSLTSLAEFVVASKVAGRVERLAVDLGDEVERGQVVAELDNGEYQQAVTQAEADLAVARANLTEARSGLEIADRALERSRTLRERGVASESQYDTVVAEKLAKEAAVAVAEAGVTRAEAALEAAKIRLGYTRITADWYGGDIRRVVAERHADAGDTVSANAPLLSIVELDPINAVFYASERDYARLKTGQPAALTTDARPGETFTGRITRMAPVFNQASRQARIEVTVPNPQRHLNPGMFARVEVVLNQADDAVIVPIEALTTRDGRDVVFAVSDDGASVSLQPVTVGMRDRGRAQVLEPRLAGRVVTLGQQLLGDGSAIIIPESEAKTEAEGQATSDGGPAAGAGAP